ncbi:MAG: hypothetical protein IKX19_04835, partial [Clostridia bacterium]|nr:hypothetical protein [Clostridia bacterium]
MAESRDNRPFAFFVPDAVVDDFLRVGSNSDDARKLIAAEFMKMKTPEAHGIYLQTLFHGGYGLNTDGGKFAAWYAEEGLRFSQGTSAEYRPDARMLTWTEAAERIDAMLTAGTFASNVEIAEALGTERRQIAEDIWFMRQDFDDEVRDRYLPSIADFGPFPADGTIESIAEHMSAPDFRAQLEGDLRTFIRDYAENRDLLNFHYHRPEEMLARLEELDLPMRSFSSDLTEIPALPAFITEDEIDRTLGAGSSYEGGKARIAAYFGEEHTSREKIAFLKKEYGIGGRAPAVSMSSGSMENHDSRGIRLQKQNCADVELSWANAVKRVERLIAQNRYTIPPETAQKREDRIPEASEPTGPENGAETGVTTPVFEPQNASDADVRAAEFVSDYNALKERYPEELVLYQVGDFYEAFGEDARRAAEILDLRLTAREIPGVGQVGLSAFPAFQLNDRLETIRDTDDAVVSSIGRNGEREIRRVLSFDHEADRALNEYEAEYGADRRRAFPGNDNEPENVGIYLGERDNTLFFYAPVNFGLDTVFRDLHKLRDDQRMIVASPVCYHDARFMTDNRISFLKIGRDIAGDRLTGKTPEEQLAAMREASEFRTPQGNAYRIGDGIHVDTASRDGAQFRIESVDEGHIYYTFPRGEYTSPFGMSRERFEQSLDDGLFTVIRDEPAQEREEAVQEPEPETAAEEPEVTAAPPEEPDNTVSVPEGPETGVTTPETEPSLPDVSVPAEPASDAETGVTTHDSGVRVYSGDRDLTDYERELGLHSIVIDFTGGSREPVVEPTPTLPPPENFRITDEHLGEGGPKAKYRMNMDAIHTLKAIEAESRNATPEEQETLSRYVGWGGIPEAFDPGKSEWVDEYAELKAALTPEEYEAARGSTLNAHYTTPTVISAIYEAVERMGFTSGNILEPSMGVGNFFGMLPEGMSESKLYGVELDSITGRIARQLYPNADITVAGFETTNRTDFFDLAVGNVPFGNYKVNDKPYNKLNFSIHNYFFAKAIDQVRPGGVIAFVTSRYTMDAQGEEARRYIAERADLLGAIRLPENAFLANANTEVVTDILFLQKRDSPAVTMPDWVGLGKNDQGYAVNRYYLDHPDMVLGRETEDHGRFGVDYTVKPREDVSLKDLLHDAVQNIRGTYREAELPDLGEGEAIRK